MLKSFVVAKNVEMVIGKLKSQSFSVEGSENRPLQA
jgi:hypothetical protein